MSGRRVSNTDVEVGRRMKLRRIDLGYSQEDVGEALGVTYQQVQKYEHGTNRVSAGRLQQIAELLKVPLQFFFADGDRQSIGDPSVLGLLETAYSLRLVKAFGRIKDRRIQRNTVELVERIADAAGGPTGKEQKSARPPTRR
jgi:transcriptional regulator with XRE-family HTH domain